MTWRPWQNDPDPDLDARLARYRQALNERLFQAKRDLALAQARRQRDNDVFWENHARDELASRLRRFNRQA